MLLVPTACGGSAIPPEKALKANERILGTSSNGTGQNTGTTGGTDPNSGQPVTGGTGGTGGTGSTGGTGGTGGGSGSTGGSGSQPPAGSGVKAGSCAGFKNGPGMTATTIKIGNSSDISGPVPGLFTAAQQATQAYVNYFNSKSNICGRKLELTNYDSKTDAGADQQSYTKLCDGVFAAVGSMSAFDSGGAATAQKCGLPDIRSAAVTLARNKCSTCFGVQATGEGLYQNEVYDFWRRTQKAATEKAAFVYLNAGAAAENAQTQISVGKKRGMNWVYTSGIDVAEFNYGPYVQQMKSKGVQFVQFLGAYQQEARFAQAMQSAGYKPKVFMLDPSAYEQGFLKQGGTAVDGVKFFVNFTPLEEHQTELDLYKKWLQQTAPGSSPTFFGLFAWSATKLFVERSIALGGKLNRASLIAQIRATNGWTGGGSHSPMNVGNKTPPVCVRWMTVKGGRFTPFTAKYICGGYTKA